MPGRISLPAFKPTEDGYAFCPKCAAGWAVIVALALFVLYLYRREKELVRTGK